MDDLIYASAVELAGLIRDRKVSAIEILDAHLDQIGKHNGALNAIVTIDQQGARSTATRADEATTRGESWGPLHGVPITIKDTIETAGIRTTAGHLDLADYVPEEDAPSVARLRNAGAVILGKTNTPRLAAGGQTMNEVFGRSNNPWNLDRTPGGSTGGGSAALASGMTPLTLGSDSGGSVRIPAHFSGIFSIKPSQHRVPLTGHIPEMPGRLRGVRNFNTIGPMARDIDDLKMSLQIISGPDQREWEVPPVGLQPVPERTLQSLKIAWVDGWEGVRVSHDTKMAIRSFAGKLSNAGVEATEEAPPGFNIPDIMRVCFRLFRSEISSTAPEDERIVEVPSLSEYVELLDSRNRYWRVLEQFFDRYDAFILPVTCGPAFEHCAHEAPIPIDGEEVDYWTAVTAHTIPFNLTGHPVVVIPIAQTSDSLPIGVQIVGRRWSEMDLLSVARAMVEVSGPFQRPPGY